MKYNIALTMLDAGWWISTILFVCGLLLGVLIACEDLLSDDDFDDDDK